MSEKLPSTASMMLRGTVHLILGVIMVLLWSFYSSEWWSAVFGFLAIFFLIEAILHMNVYGAYPFHHRK